MLHDWCYGGCFNVLKDSEHCGRCGNHCSVVGSIASLEAVNVKAVLNFVVLNFVVLNLVVDSVWTVLQVTSTAVDATVRVIRARAIGASTRSVF